MNLSMYSPVEQAILAEYFEFRVRDEIDDLDLDLWAPDPQDPSAIFLEPDAWNTRCLDTAVRNAVARMALARVQRSLPQIAFFSEEGIKLGRPLKNPPARLIEMLSRRLFTIDWAMTAPMVSWPESYYLTWMPGVEQWLVTSSRDTPEIGGYCDTALGCFESGKDPIEGAGVVIGGYWCDQMVEYGQPRWEMFFDAGMVSREEAESWADEVWQEPEWEEEEEFDDSQTKEVL